MDICSDGKTILRQVTECTDKSKTITKDIHLSLSLHSSGWSPPLTPCTIRYKGKVISPMSTEATTLVFTVDVPYMSQYIRTEKVQIF